ncbi:hypothetical protein NDA07_25985, partial [Microcoleus vaginatus DQ-U2]|uniref:DUF433 domain-containing protein n=1 Tax=Microcoleus vaginatus TaxID=119532 RepID=UPI0019A8ADB1|nr:hypothetical protein [Microcoleus sp. FACHB-DQ6]
GSTALSRFFSALWWLWAFSFLYFTRCRHLSFFDLNPYESFPDLTAADLVNAWAYADAYPEEIETAIIENEAA